MTITIERNYKVINTEDIYEGNYWNELETEETKNYKLLISEIDKRYNKKTKVTMVEISNYYI